MGSSLELNDNGPMTSREVSPVWSGEETSTEYNMSLEQIVKMEELEERNPVGYQFPFSRLTSGNNDNVDIED